MVIYTTKEMRKQMPKYEVRIDLNSITYELEADNQDEAITLSHKLALNETQYDLLKWAEYDVKEIDNG